MPWDRENRGRAGSGSSLDSRGETPEAKPRDSDDIHQREKAAQRQKFYSGEEVMESRNQDYDKKFRSMHRANSREEYNTRRANTKSLAKYNTHADPIMNLPVDSHVDVLRKTR